MKKKYTQEDIDQFFGNFKELPEYYDLEKVHHLMNHPDAKATQAGNNYFKPFKFLIMSSAIIAVVASLLLWPEEPMQTSIKDETSGQPTSISAKTDDKEENLPATPLPEEKSEILPVKEKKAKQEESSAKSITIAKGTTKKIPQKEKTASPIIKPEADNDSLAANQSPLWPADTVIDGSQFLITLTDEELEKLGFELRETGIYYKNIFDGDSIHFHKHFDNGHGEMHHPSNVIHLNNIKTEYSHFNFYPVTSTDIYYRRGKYKDDFEFKNDTLVPVILQNHQLKHFDDQILWFKMSNDFFNSLPERYDHLQASYNQILRIKKNNNKEIDIVKYETEMLNGEMQLLEISKEKLQSIGFEIFKNKLQFKSIFEDAIVLLIFEKEEQKLNGGKKIDFIASVNISMNKEELKPTKNAIAFVSDTLGYQSLRWKRPSEGKEKNEISYFQEKTQFLIPILIRQKDYPEALSEDKIFWFEPSEALFSALPEEIGNQLRQEYTYLTSTEEQRVKEGLSSSCTFFEACKATLQLNEIKLYPNPASSITTLSFSGLEENTGSISLVNISGTRVKELIPSTTFRKGQNSFQFDLTGISPGIYIISINTDQGFKTQRLIISR